VCHLVVCVDVAVYVDVLVCVDIVVRLGVDGKASQGYGAAMVSRID